jgi:hypothetical protein
MYENNLVNQELYIWQKRVFSYKSKIKIFADKTFSTEQLLFVEILKI